MQDPYTLLRGQGPLVLTCEHATERLPIPLAWPEEDRRLVGTHWAFDLGARELAHELALATQSAAVFSNFSRLVIDPNRELDSPTLFRAEAEGGPVHLNHRLTDAARQERIEKLYHPFHDVVHRTVQDASAPTILSVHSFTPVYEGAVRPMEIGVLFDDDEDEAHVLGEALERAGFVVAYNAPYSGKEGLIHSVDRHAKTHGRIALEIEVRQDRAVDPAFRLRLVQTIAALYSNE